MSYDYYYALRDKENVPQKKEHAFGLASGFVDKCTVWACREKPPNQKGNPKNEARESYMKQASDLHNLSIPDDCRISVDFSCLPDPSWLGINVDFTLETPWYSKDDRPFHVLDNPVRKDRVFGVPFMSAASWKGMLRWACRMQEGLLKHLKTDNCDWKDPDWIIHLFGNEKGVEEISELRSGALVFYPTWFSRVDFEVINPHSRKTKAGTIPIVYEVVPAGTKGILRLLYASAPGQVARDEVKSGEVMEKLIDAITVLLGTYGISAKRTVGWGTAHIDRWSGFMKVNEKGQTGEKIQPEKKTVKSFKDITLPETKPVCKASFDEKKAEDFKRHIGERFALTGGER